ncbi:YkgJ family cysteine cluster protein [Archaeoglobales archaeon]|nr:MAG: YkgJ family cysteine cluster protein [Archaeoglobales archaeon]
MHVPWRRVSSWHCTACGECCERYRVRLTTYEYLKLRATGFVEEKAGRFYIKKFGSKCPFQYGNLCMLQNKLKPSACRLFPFVVRKRGVEEAYFEFEGESYYVYVDTFCPNLKLKSDTKPSKKIIPLIIEAIKIYKGEVMGVELLTARVANQSHHQTSFLAPFQLREGRITRKRILLL